MVASLLQHQPGSERLLEHYAAAAEGGTIEHVAAWVALRRDLHQRIPPDISEAPDVLKALEDLGRGLHRLRRTLADRERDLRTDAKAIGSTITSQRRRAGNKDRELSQALASVRFGTVKRIELQTRPVAVMNDLLAALVAEHSKAPLGAEHLAMLGDTRVTRDGAALIRPNDGLEIERGGVTYRAEEISEVQGVLAMTQRALADGTRLGGQPPEVVMTVENLGAFVDMPKPGWMLLVHVPGWNMPLAVEVIRALGAGRVIHFGDLDPNGVRIYEALRARLGEVELWMPEALLRGVLNNAPARACEWPEGLLEARHPALLHELAAAGRWAEQERVAVAEGVVHRRQAPSRSSGLNRVSTARSSMRCSNAAPFSSQSPLLSWVREAPEDVEIVGHPESFDPGPCFELVTSMTREVSRARAG